VSHLWGILNLDADWRRSARQFAIECRMQGEPGRKRFWEWIGEAAESDMNYVVAALCYWSVTEAMSSNDLVDAFDDWVGDSSTSLTDTEV
jgi:hypothetical protein